MASPTAACLAVAIVLGAVLRFLWIGHQSYWYDEAVTEWLVRLPLHRTMALLGQSESTPPLYYVVAWGWARGFGFSEAGLRSLSALAGVLAVPVAFAAGRLLAGTRAGLAAAFLVAVNPFLIWYSQEARSYSLLVLTSAVALWCFARAREQPTPPRLAVWGLAAAVALCTHYFAVFALVPMALLLAVDRRASLRARLAGLAIPAVAGIALIGLAHRQSARIYWFRRKPLRLRIDDVGRHFLVGFTPPATTIAAGIVGVAMLAAVALLVLRGERSSRRGALVALAIVAGAAGVPIAMAFAGADYVNTRNVIAAIVPLAIVVGAGLGVRRFGAVAVALLA